MEYNEGFVAVWKKNSGICHTSPKFNIAPEKLRLEDDPFLLEVTFQGLC